MIISMLSNINPICSSLAHSPCHECDGLFFAASRALTLRHARSFTFLSTIVSVFFVSIFERVIAMLSFFFVANYRFPIFLFSC